MWSPRSTTTAATTRPARSDAAGADHRCQRRRPERRHHPRRRQRRPALLMTDYHLAIMPATDGRIDRPRPTASAATSSKATSRACRRPDAQPELLEGRPRRFDQVEILSILDPAARLNALITGEVHLIRPGRSCHHRLCSRGRGGRGAPVGSRERALRLFRWTAAPAPPTTTTGAAGAEIRARTGRRWST